MFVRRVLFGMLASAAVVACTHRGTQRATKAAAGEKTLFTDSTLYARLCRMPGDSLMPVPDSASRKACELRDQRQIMIKIF
jgi:hypothetical protein